MGPARDTVTLVRVTTGGARREKHLTVPSLRPVGPEVVVCRHLYLEKTGRPSHHPRRVSAPQNLADMAVWSRTRAWCWCGAGRAAMTASPRGPEPPSARPCSDKPRGPVTSSGHGAGSPCSPLAGKFLVGRDVGGKVHGARGVAGTSVHSHCPHPALVLRKAGAARLLLGMCRPCAFHSTRRHTLFPRS